MKMKVSSIFKRALLYFAVFVFLFGCLAPFIWVFIGSLHPTQQILTGDVTFIPDNPTLKNYIPLFASELGIKNFHRYIVNSLIVGLGTALLSSIISSVGAYGLSRYEFRGKNVLARLMLFVYVFPVILVALPVHQMMARVNLADSRLGIILIHTALAAPFCTWLLRSFFDSIPNVIEESAAVDGASQLQSMFYIVLPLAAPGVITAGVYALVSSWGEYLFVSILINSDSVKTLPLGIGMYTAEQYIEWGQLLAGTVLVFLPLFLIFLPLSRYFIQGFMEGAIK